MSDDPLVKRLRDLAVDLSGAYIDHPDGDISTPDHAFGVADVSAAAARIEALEAETARLSSIINRAACEVDNACWHDASEILAELGSSTPLEPPQEPNG